MAIQVDRGATPRVPDRTHVLRQGVHDQILGLLMLAVSVVVLLFPMATHDGPKDAQVNELVVGLVVAFAAGARLYRGGGVWSDAVVGLAGAWLIASPFVLDAQNTAVHTADRMLCIVAGSVLVVLSLVSAAVWWSDRGSRKGSAGASHHE
ncbi:SPW repeat domain-containing protein [Streptomyces cinereoruber]|uniref:SPW repeat domain-containing protein n=1 Tax=Streptomyces cinereoruber TaxID=67260 RepID=UPI0036385A69